MSIAALLIAASASHGLLYETVLDQLSQHGAHGAQAAMSKAFAGLADSMITLDVSSDEDKDAKDAADDPDDVERLEVIPPAPPAPPVAPLPPIPPLGPDASAAEQRAHDQRVQARDRAQAALDRAQAAVDRAHGTSIHLELHREAEPPLPPFSETAKQVGTVDLLHRIARTAGWSMTLVGSPRETVDIDVKDADPREALRQVLKQSGAMGVLKRDRLVVVASPGESTSGLLVEQSSRHGKRHGGGSTRGSGSNDITRIFQGDITVPQGTVVQGDVVCVGGSIELEPGSVVQGDAVAVMGSVTVDEGALVLGQGVAVLGEVDVRRGAQVMGEHVQIGLGRLFSHSRRSHSFLSSLGPFGLFPTLALFALTYLLGLLGLRMWPDRVRMVGHAFFESPVRSFFIGFLCWLLLLPLVVLLCISIVGILLLPLLPVVIFLSIVLGLSSFALTLGESLPAGPGQRFVPPAALGMGMAVLLLLGLVPWLGISLLALLQFFALGAAVGSRFGRALPPHVA